MNRYVGILGCDIRVFLDMYTVRNIPKRLRLTYNLGRWVPLIVLLPAEIPGLSCGTGRHFYIGCLISFTSGLEYFFIYFPPSLSHLLQINRNSYRNTMATSDHIVSNSEGTKASVANVNFVCQKCYQPLKLDSSFGNIDKRLYTDLTSPITAIPKDDNGPEAFNDKSNQNSTTNR